MSSRYARQTTIPGWDQEKLRNSKVAIVGAGELGFFTALPLVCLGVGKIEIFDNTPVTAEAYPYIGRRGNPKSMVVADYLGKINPNVKVTGNRTKIDMFSTPNLAPYDVLVDCGNDQKTTDLIYDYAKGKNKYLIGVRRSLGGGEIAALPHKVSAPAKKEPDPGADMLLGGIAAEEVRKTINPLTVDDKILDQKMQYDQFHGRRFYQGDRAATSDPGRFDPGTLRTVVIGAGGTGCFGNLGLVLMGVGELTFYDYDKVDNTNLNRQFLHYDSVGEYKVDSLVKKVATISKGKVYGKNKQITADNIREIGKPDYLIDCVDNVRTRSDMNRYSQTKKIPLIKIGTNERQAEVVVCVPGETPCLNCYTNIDELVAATPEHCDQNPVPSVVTSNQIAVGIALKEFENLVRGIPPFIGTLNYHASAPSRGFGSDPELFDCGCGYRG